MKINNNQISPVSFNMRILPDMRKKIFYETKKIFNKKTASQVLNELLNAGTDKSVLKDFNIEILKNKKIYCDLFIKTPKNKGTQFTLIHTFLKREGAKNIKFNLNYSKTF